MKGYCHLCMCLLLIVGLTACGLFGSGAHDHTKLPGGTVVWRHANVQENIVQTEPLITGGMVYYLQDGQLKAATLKNGKVRWKKVIDSDGAGGDFSFKILESGDKVFYDEGFSIDAFDKQTGKLIWKAQVTNDPRDISGIGFPIMSQGRKYLYAGREGYVVKVRKSDGQIDRRFPLDKLVPEGLTQGATDPDISPFGDHILYVSASFFDRSKPTFQKASGGNIFAYNARSGSLVWKHHVSVTEPNLSTNNPGDSLQVSPNIYDIAVTRNKIIILSGNYIVALNRMSGHPVWKSFIPDGGFDKGLTVKGNSIYAASAGQIAVKLDLKTGKLRWKYDVIFSNANPPTVKDGRMYFASDGGGGIWVLDTTDGSVIYHRLPPNYKKDEGDTYISSLGVGEGYMVDVGGEAVYCLTVP